MCIVSDADMLRLFLNLSIYPQTIYEQKCQLFHVAEKRKLFSASWEFLLLTVLHYSTPMFFKIQNFQSTLPIPYEVKEAIWH